MSVIPNFEKIKILKRDASDFLQKAQLDHNFPSYFCELNAILHWPMETCTYKTTQH